MCVQIVGKEAESGIVQLVQHCFVYLGKQRQNLLYNDNNHGEPIVTSQLPAPQLTYSYEQCS